MYRVERTSILERTSTLAMALFLALALSAFSVGGARLAAAQEEATHRGSWRRAQILLVPGHSLDSYRIRLISSAPKVDLNFFHLRLTKYGTIEPFTRIRYQVLL